MGQRIRSKNRRGFLIMEHVKQIAIKAVGEVLGVSYAQMNEMGPNNVISRKQEYVKARRLVYFIITERFPSIPYKELGRIFQDQDHSTVINAVNKHMDYYQTDKSYAYTSDRAILSFDEKLKRYESKSAIESPEYRSHIQDTLKKCLQESERYIEILKEAVTPSIQDLGFSVVNLNE